MTSTIVRTYTVGETPDEYVYTHGAHNWCSKSLTGPDGYASYYCSIQRGHDGPQHVAANEYRIVAVEDRPEHTLDPLEAWKATVREQAKYICESRGYGSWPVWNAAMVKIGLEPFVQRKARIVAPVQRVTQDLGDRSEEDAREWLEARRHRLADYLRPAQADLGEPTVEIVEEAEGAEGVEKDPRADTDDLDEYKAFVRDFAIEMGTEQGWCDDGVNGVLDELGLPRKTRAFRVAVQIQAYQTVYVDVTASDESAARDQVGRSDIRYAIDSSGWSWDGDWESDDAEVEEV